MDKLKSIYLVLDEEKFVTAITESETPYKYCEVEDEVEIEDIVEFLELEKYAMKFENGALVVVKEVETETTLVTLEEMQEQIALAVSEVTEMVATMLEGVMPNE